MEEKEKLELKEYQFLTQKPIFYILNVNGKTNVPSLKFPNLQMNLKDEEGLTELTETEIKELNMNSQLDQLIINCYNILDLITFYTVTGGKETRAWTLKRGQTAPEAGAVVHTDFKEKFIRAEVINWQQLVEAGSWTEAREKGLIQTVGKEYVVQDGDVMEFKI